ncbi:MAG: hypothetical protein Q8M08_01025 [Bacteroidales bacterium]|nr:hypothetical protein [Bacteroidales bacterium]
MRNKKYIFLVALYLWALPAGSFGQLSDFKTRMEGKESFQQIVETAEEYFKTRPSGQGSDRLEKHFARWAYYRSMHLGPAGEFVNISEKTLEAISNLPDAPQTTTNGSWSFIGPNNSTLAAAGSLNGNGRVDRIAFHPTLANTIYVGTPAGGLWRTTDGGNNWTPISSYIPSLGISGIVVSYANPNTLYVLTGDGDGFIGNYFVNLFGYLHLSVGVLVSYDAGVTWQKTGDLAAGNYVGYRLVQHPTNANILIAATSAGIYRTTNGGTTWVLELAGRYFDVEFKPGSPATVYASGVGSFVYSTDTGDNWNAGATFDIALCGGRVELAVSPNAPNRVYLLAGPFTNGIANFCGFYTSNNSGISFTRLTNTPNVLNDEASAVNNDQSMYDLCVAVKPTDSQRILVGGLVTFRSINGGSTFTNATTYWEAGGNYIHPDVHDVAYNPLNNNLYAATDGGLYRSADDGVTWTNLMAGINSSQFFHIDDFDANANAILGGCQDNGVKYRVNNSTTFNHIASGDGADGAIDYTNSARGYSTINRSVRRFDNFLVSPSTSVATSPTKWFPKLELNSSNPDVLYYSYDSIFQYVRSTGVITSFAGAAFSGAWALKTCPSNSLRVYAAGGTTPWAAAGNLHVTSNGGANWTTVSTNPGFPANFPRISDIGVRPTNSPQVFVTFSGYTAGVKVLYSANAGVSWTNISYDLPNIPIWSVEVDASNNVYVGGDFGIYYHVSGSTKWEPFYNNMPNVPVTDLAINEGSDQLLAATFGRGIWRSQLYGACPANLNIASNVTGEQFSSASNSITMSGKVTGGAGTSAVLRAGNYVDLTPGFQANSDPGNKFMAYNGACGSGMPPLFLPVTFAFPAELEAYEMDMTRNKGTLEVIPSASMQKEVVVRLFTDGNARVLLATSTGEFIRDVATFTNSEGKYSYPVNGADLTNGVYYLYLVVNNKVVHLQEMEI